MTRPLFSEGEQVILCSKKLPQCNGEYTVHAIHKEGDLVPCRFTGEVFAARGSALGYALTPPVNLNRFEALWCQSALRKKYPPSTESFKEMMSNLNKVVA